MKEKSKIKKYLTKAIKELDININNMNFDDIVRLNQELNNEDLLSYYVEGFENTWGEYTENITYYSKKLDKVIIFDGELNWDFEGESINSMVESIYEMELDIRAFEDSLSIKLCEN